MVEPDPIPVVEIVGNEAFILQFALRTARADIIRYTVTDCDLRGPEMTQIIQKRTWGLITFANCHLDAVAVTHIEGTGGTVTPAAPDADINGSEHD